MFHRQKKSFSLQEWILPGVLIAFAAIFSYLGSSFRIASKAEETEMSYEMIRPTSYASVFSLAGKEIRRIVKDPFVKEAPTAKVAAGNGTVAGVPMTAQGKPVDPKNAKKTDDKKKTTAKNTKKKSKISVEVIETQGSTLNANAVSGGAAETTAAPVGGYVPQVGIIAPAGPEKPAARSEKKVTPAQLLAQIESQPTNGVAAVGKAYTSGDLSDQELNDLVGQLIVSKDPKKQRSALQIIQNIPSSKSFEMLVVNNANLAKENQLVANQIIKTYESPMRFSVLIKAFYSEKSEVVLAASEVLSSALSKIQSQQATPATGGRAAGGRESRGDSASATPANFLQFLPVLKYVISKGNTSVVASVQALLDAIQKFSQA